MLVTVDVSFMAWTVSPGTPAGVRFVWVSAAATQVAIRSRPSGYPRGWVRILGPAPSRRIHRENGRRCAAVTSAALGRTYNEGEACTQENGR